MYPFLFIRIIPELVSGSSTFVVTTNDLRGRSRNKFGNNPILCYNVGTIF